MSYTFKIPPGTEFPHPTEYMLSSNLLQETSCSRIYLINYINPLKSAIKCVAKVINDKRNVAEYHIAKELKHKNVLSPLGLYKDFDHIIIFYPYIAGGDLETLTERNNGINEQLARNIFKQMVIAVEYIHSKNIVHHDLKLENFLYDGTTVKLIDFGLAEYCKPGATIKIPRGTPYYMAPEVLSKCGHKISSQIWSLGVCLFRLLYNKFPWESKTEDELIKKVHYTSLRWPNDRTVSSRVKLLMRNCLIVSPDNRITISEILKIILINKVINSSGHTTSTLNRWVLINNKHIPLYKSGS